MADPFALTPAAPAAPGPGFLGIPASTWQNLANFGANTAVAANARTPQGFLEYGTSPAGALGEGMLQTEQQAKDTAGQLAQQQLVGAQAQGQQILNLQNALQIPKLEALNKLYTDPNFLSLATGQGAGGGQQAPQSQSSAGAPAAGMQPTSNNVTLPPQGYSASPNISPNAPSTYSSLPSGQATAAGATPNAPGSEGMDPYLQVTAQLESGGKAGARNASGYSGLFAQGAAAMADAGVYTPAKGEDLTKNLFQGTFNVRGYEPASYAQFMANPQMQVAAAKIQEAKNWQDIQENHLDYMIGQNVGGVQITQPALLSMVHLGGLQGAVNFIKTNGQYNPADSNGVTLAMRANQVNQGMYQYYQRQGQGAPAQFNPQYQMNAQDQLGPLAKPGMYTPGRATELAQQYYGQARALSWLNPTAAAAAQAQGDMYNKMAQQAYVPQQYRANGGGVDSEGNVMKFSGPTTVNQGGTDLLAAETGGLSVNGQTVVPPQAQIVTPTGGAAGAAAGTDTAASSSVQSQNVAAPQAANAPGGVPAFGGQQAAPPSSADVVFDAALMGKQMPKDDPNLPIYAEIPVGQKEIMTSGVERIDGMLEDAGKQAQSAAQSNAMLTEMQNTQHTWTSDKFAGWKNDARTWELALKDQFGINDPALEQQVGDFATFQKNAQQLIQERVRQVSPRASTQEYTMIGASLPSPEIGNNALVQITAELKGGNDFPIARNWALSKWHEAQGRMTPNQQYIQTLGDFDAKFLSRVTPYTFMMHRLTETPAGQVQFQGMVHNMQKTPQGRAELARLGAQMQYAQQAGLFDAVDGGGGSGQ